MKAVASVAFLALLFWAGAADAVCDTLPTTTCTTCTADPQCGWCAPTATCMQGNVSGPAGDARCLGAAWSFPAGGNPCVTCSAITSCRQCVDWSADCEWCGNDASPTPPYGHCVDLGKNVLGCTKTDQCSCKGFSECSDCNEAKGCGWCGQTDSCVALSDQNACSMIAHTCPCSKYSACQACDADSNCVWCTNSSAPGKGQCNQAGPMGGCGSLLAPLSCDTFCQSQGGACGSCVGLEGCGWCSGINKCKDSSFNNQDCPFVAHTCPIDCGNGVDCTSCNALGGGCQWCEGLDSGACKSTSRETCEAWILDCYPADNTVTCKKFDGGAFVGGMFTVIGVLVLGAAGYFFYRWKMGQRVKYTELGG